MATDVVSRGIDIDSIELVVNYDVPPNEEDYVHRIGRTARAERKGEAITLVTPDDMRRFGKIERLIEKEVPKLKVPESLGTAPTYDPKSSGGRGRGNSPKGGGSGRNHRGGASRGGQKQNKGGGAHRVVERRNLADVRNRQEDWKHRLTEEEHRVMRENGTERPHSSELNMEWRQGDYPARAVIKNCSKVPRNLMQDAVGLASIKSTKKLT